MNAIADKYAPRGVGSILVHTHEAHPGEFCSHSTSMEHKFEHARDLRDKLGVMRRILVDALDGACHRAYGSMPNMSWIFSQTGMPVYKSDWSDSHSVENAIIYFLEVVTQRRAHDRLPRGAARLPHPGPDAFYKGLERNGPKAVREFREAFK